MNKRILLLSLLISAGIWCQSAHAVESFLSVGNNQLTYGGLLLNHQTNIYNYYAIVHRGGRDYTTRIHDTDYAYITPDDPHWRTHGANTAINTGAPGTSNWFIQSNLSADQPEIVYVLDDDQLDFAALGFTYRIQYYGNYRTKQHQRSYFTVQLCQGETYAFNGEGTTRIILPNSGCDQNHRELVIRPLDYNTGPFDYFRLAISQFSLDVAPQTIDTRIEVARRDGAEFAYVPGEAIACQDTVCPVAYNDRIRVSDLLDGQVESTAEWSDGWYCFNYDFTQNSTMTITEVVREPDESITVSYRPGGQYYVHSVRPAAVLLGVSATPETLLEHWEDVTPITDTSREDYHGIRAVAHTRDWQVANFAPTGDGFDWERGFYLTLRWQDYWGDVSDAAPLYYCQGSRCQATDYTGRRSAYFSLLGLGAGDAYPPFVRVQVDDPEYPWDNLLVYERQDEGVTPQPDWEFGLSATLPWPTLSRQGGTLYLYDRQRGEVIDTVEYGPLAAPLGLVRDTATWQWKVNYVRN